MPFMYEPKDHILPLEIAPRAEGILDQREITIQSYQTTETFNFNALRERLEESWLSPTTRFGVFACAEGTIRNQSLAFVLGLQDEISVRAYDYEERRPLWYSWKNIIVDTVSIRYFKNENGMLCFTTMGGGRRITDDRINEFNCNHLHISKESVIKRQFDLAKLRDLCFGRFINNLYMIKFKDPSGKEYRSIDHGFFKSRRYINPSAERLQEVQQDYNVKIESFDSDITVHPRALAEAAQIRFDIRGTSGSLHLRFPKLVYQSQLTTPEEQARVFYEIVEATVNSILDADYYAEHLNSLSDVDAELDMFPEMVDLAPLREALLKPAIIQEFFRSLDLGAPRNTWQPHLYAIDELLEAENMAGQVKTLIIDIAVRDPLLAARLLDKCQKDAKMYRVGHIVAEVAAKQLQSFRTEFRPHIEETLLAWAIQHEADSWDIDLESDEIQTLNLRWKKPHLSSEVLPIVLWKLAGLFHHRLSTANGETDALLRRFNWCMTAAKELPVNYYGSNNSLRLVVEQKVPARLSESAKIIKDPVTDLVALDNAILNQFGLPLWPFLSASHQDGKVLLKNTGIGAALDIRTTKTKTLFGNEEAAGQNDLHSDESIELAVCGNTKNIDVWFSKFGREYHVKLPIEKTQVVSESKKTKNRPSATEMKNRDSAVLVTAIKLQEKYGRLPTVSEIFEETKYSPEQIYATAAYKDGKIAKKTAKPTSEMTGSSINQSEYFEEKSIAHSRADRLTKSQQIERDGLIDQSKADDAKDEKQHKTFLRKKRNFNSEE